ncbi:MAG: type I-D CRISPR-associated protein Cas7/Csc2 [Thermoplasmatales archaeon]
MTSEIGREIMKHIGSDFFTTESVDREGEIPALCQNNARNITLVMIRETIAPFINRSNIPDESVWFRISEKREVIHVPARKFKSREKMFGIKLLRYLSMVDKHYRYNHLTARAQFINPTSVLMGETIVFPDKGETTLSIPSRALYSDVYSIRDREYITDKLTNNALNEEGTMYDRDKGTTSSAFFSTEYVIPGVFFPAFITLKDPTPELLLHLIFSLRQTAYGASTATTGTNFRNHLIGIVGSRIEPPVSSYLVSLKYPFTENNSSNDRLLFDDVKKHITSLVKENLTDGAVLIADEKLVNFLQYVNSLKLGDDKVKEAYNQVMLDIQKYLSYSFDKPESKRGKKKDIAKEQANGPGGGSSGNIQG